MSLLRKPLIALSRSSKAQDLIVAFPFSRRASRRFVAGEKLEDAIEAIRKINAQGMVATLDYLGESVHTKEEAWATGDEYLRILDAIQQSGVKSDVSLKLTALGLDIGDEFCLQNAQRIVDRAADYNNSVAIDMESSDYTDRTLAIVRTLHQRYSGVSTVIQAYLKRSEADVRSLIEQGIAVRLVKGAYDEPSTVAFRQKSRVDACLIYLVKLMLSPEAQSKGAYTAVASHDDQVIAAAEQYAQQNQVSRDRWEFQMLYGIRRDRQLELMQKGYTMRLYVPYGTHWYPYFMRRLAERPANLVFFLRALVGA